MRGAGGFQPPLRSISPPWSIATLRSLDISSNIPSGSQAADMDAEDSPWGDVPSTSSSKPGQAATGDDGGDIVHERAHGETEAKQIPDSKPESVTSPRSAAGTGSRGRGPRTPRTPRRMEVQSSRLEALDDEAGPLGPLGESTASSIEPAPTPPSKEQPLPVRNARAPAAEQRLGEGAQEGIGFADDLDSRSARSRAPPPVQPPLTGAENTRRQVQPSMSVEQAAKPSFNITVGDPHKVGDLTSSHIVYQVHTKTSSKAYKQPEFTVTRRYRDFLWLFNSLHNNNPGVVVPPPPEKQAVGRFDTNFVESRRAALERMLNKVALHTILQHDSDLKIFLESDAFNADIKHREHREPGLGEPKSGGGLMSSLGLGGSSGSKFVEHDDWFHERRIYLDALENQLKALLKGIDSVVTQRKALSEGAGELSGSLAQLSAVELAPHLSGPLQGLSDVQFRIRELHERQAQQDVLTLGITIDEYIRLIGSVKTAFAQRQKSYSAWHAAEADLQKRRTTQDKVLRSGKTQQDRLNQLQADVAEGERRCHQARLLCEDMGRLMRNELERFEREKVEDFKSGLETFLEGAVEAQKELIEIWETYLMQFDADDEEEPFFKPNVIQTEPISTSQPPDQQQQQQQQQQPPQQRQPPQEGSQESAGPSSGANGSVQGGDEGNAPDAPEAATAEAATVAAEEH